VDVAMIVCQACGHELPESSRFCGHCGAKLGALPDKTQAQTHDTIFGLAALSPGDTLPASDAHAAVSQTEIADETRIIDEPLQNTIITEPILGVVDSTASSGKTVSAETASAPSDAQSDTSKLVSSVETEDTIDAIDMDSADALDDDKPTIAHLEAVSKCEVMSGRELSAHTQEALHVSDDDTVHAQAVHTGEMPSENEAQAQVTNQNDDMLFELERQIEEGKKAAERLEALRQQRIAAEAEAARIAELVAEAAKAAAEAEAAKAAAEAEAAKIAELKAEAAKATAKAEAEAARVAAETEAARAAAVAEAARVAAVVEAARAAQREVEQKAASSQADDNKGKGKRKGNKGRVRVRSTSGTLESRQEKLQETDIESDELQSAAAIPEPTAPKAAATKVSEPAPQATAPLLATVSQPSPKYDSGAQPSIKPKAIVEMGEDDEEDEAFEGVFDEDDEESFFGKRMSQQFSVVNLAAVGRTKAKKSGKRRTIILAITLVAILGALAFVILFL